MLRSKYWYGRLSPQTVVPTLCYLLGCDLPRIRTAILAGTGLPMLMFVAWSAVILGTIPYDAPADAAADPLGALRASGDGLGETLRVFSLLAVGTSFIGFTLGLVDFAADLLGMPDAEIAEMDVSEGSEGSDDGAQSAGRPLAQKAPRTIVMNFCIMAPTCPEPEPRLC